MSVKEWLGGAMWRGVLTALVLLVLLLGAAALMLQRGLLPESAAPAMVCAACAAAVFAGGRCAVRNGSGAPMGQALTVAVGLYAAMWLVALGGAPRFSVHGPALTASVFGGGLLAGLCGEKQGKRQTRKHRAGDRARVKAGKKRR